MSKRSAPPAGEVRQSQVVTTYGPGAMVDLPHHSVLVGGLDLWRGDMERIFEPRLEAWLCEQRGVGEIKLYAPPVDPEQPGAKRSGIGAILFPTWFLGLVEETWTAPDGRVYRTRPLIPWTRLVKGGYLDRERRVRPVVPVRFVQACVRGHISDVNWYGFVRKDHRAARTGELWFDEGGAGNDFADIFVRDEQTGARRPLSDATVPNGAVLGRCEGQKPWLGPRMRDECDKPSRLLTRAASNAYFSQTMSAIAIPDAGEALREAVERVWEDHLRYADSEQDVRSERRREKVAAALEGLTDAAVWQEVVRRKRRVPVVQKGIKQAELETFMAQKPSLGEDKPEGDFYAREHPFGGRDGRGNVPRAVADKVDRLVLVHRLREVTVQVGFTRFEAVMTDIEGELDLGVESAPLSRELVWLPASENRGEGIFLSFRREAIDAWLERPAVKARARALLAGFEAWQSRAGKGSADFAGLPYIMLHTLSHLLITALSLDCGYSASAIRERVYAGEAGFGILLHTGTSGSEGTLGGLVEVGKGIGRHLERALELGRLCSNDPVCAQHGPADRHEERFLHGAACHGCVLIGETSCERRNELLDRALVVPTVATPGAAFFGDLA